MDKLQNSPEKSEKSDKTSNIVTNDTVEKLKKDNDSKLRTKTPSPKLQKGSLKKPKAKPLKSKTKSEESLTISAIEPTKKNTEPKPKTGGTLSRPMPLSKKAALGQETLSPKRNASAPQETQTPNKSIDGSNNSNAESYSIKPPPPKRQKLDISGNQQSPCDPYCWVCHKEGTTLDCQVCPRSFHVKCDSQSQNPNEQTQDPKNWICKECRAVILAEDTDTRSPAMAMLTIEQLCNLLKYALNRIKQQALKLLVDSQPDAFNKPVSVEEYPRYLDYVVHPIDLSLLEKNIKKRVYGSTEAFIADVKWLHHNSVIFNGSGHRLTTVAKGLVNTCKVEMKEIEICPDCYLHAHTMKDNWFLEPCRKAHVLVWAKLKGFPYWPGKVMQVENGNADVRFFGAHDRAWVPIHLCYLLSYEMPQPLKVKKKAAFDSSLEELDAHIQKLRVKLGGFDYAPPKTPLDSDRLYLQAMSKVSTGRRHSDADQNAFAKGRTVTIVTSSWMRRLQAEGFAKPKDKKELKKSPKKTKKSPANSAPPPTSRMRMSTSQQSEIGKSNRSEPQIKVENQQNDQDSTEQAKNPPPMGVFEISDSSSLDINRPLKLLSPSIILNKVQMTPSVSAAEKIKQRFMARSSSDDEEQNVEIEEETSTTNILSPQRSTSKTSEVPEIEPVVNENVAPKDTEKDAEKETSPSAMCEVTSTTSLIDNNQDIELAVLSAQLTPKKTNSLFVQKLQETIQSCKKKLGIIEAVDDEIVMPTTESEGDEEEEMSTNHLTDHEELENVDNGLKIQGSGTETVGSESNKEPELSKIVNSPHDDFSSISSDGGENLVIDENPGNDATSPNQRIEEMEISKSPRKDNAATSPTQAKKGSKRNNEGVQLPSEATTSSLPKKPEQIEKNVSEDISQITSLASPSIDHQGFNNGASHLAESDPTNITNYAHKLIDFMQELCKDAGSPGNPQATIRSLELEVEKLKWKHQQELLEIKHNTDLILLEVRASMELDKRKCLAEMREKLEMEKQRTIMEMKLEMEKEKQKAIETTKKTQWCANCGKEAIFYCCWNTSYCDYSCQQSHWMTHMNLCTQNQPTTQSSISNLQTTPNISTMSANKTTIPTPQLTRRVTPHSSTPILSGPVQLQYVSGNQCYQLIPTSTIVTPNNSTLTAAQLVGSRPPM